MISTDYVATMAACNGWMNERLYELCGGLVDTVRKRDAGAFFGSIHGTLNHLLLGDRIWLGRFLGRPFSVTSLAQELYADFDKLRRERAHTDREIAGWAATLTEAALAGDLVYISVVNPQQRRLALWLAVVHFFNHQTHHRGQLTTLLMQNGVDPGVTDLLWSPQVQAASR
jgi:uncharacterized damage-inducible protein DinB